MSTPPLAPPPPLDLGAPAVPPPPAFLSAVSAASCRAFLSAAQAPIGADEKPIKIDIRFERSDGQIFSTFTLTGIPLEIASTTHYERADGKGSGSVSRLIAGDGTPARENLDALAAHIAASVEAEVTPQLLVAQLRTNGYAQTMKIYTPKKGEVTAFNIADWYPKPATLDTLCHEITAQLVISKFKESVTRKVVFTLKSAQQQREAAFRTEYTRIRTLLAASVCGTDYKREIFSDTFAKAPPAVFVGGRCGPVDQAALALAVQFFTYIPRTLLLGSDMRAVIGDGFEGRLPIPSTLKDRVQEYVDYLALGCNEQLPVESPPASTAAAAVAGGESAAAATGADSAAESTPASRKRAAPKSAGLAAPVAKRVVSKLVKADPDPPAHCPADGSAGGALHEDLAPVRLFREPPGSGGERVESESARAGIPYASGKRGPRSGGRDFSATFKGLPKREDGSYDASQYAAHLAPRASARDDDDDESTEYPSTSSDE